MVIWVTWGLRLVVTWIPWVTWDLRFIYLWFTDFRLVVTWIAWVTWDSFTCGALTLDLWWLELLELLEIHLPVVNWLETCGQWWLELLELQLLEIHLPVVNWLETCGQWVELLLGLLEIHLPEIHLILYYYLIWYFYFFITFIILCHLLTLVWFWVVRNNLWHSEDEVEAERMRLAHQQKKPLTAPFSRLLTGLAISRDRVQSSASVQCPVQSQSPSPRENQSVPPGPPQSQSQSSVKSSHLTITTLT